MSLQSARKALANFNVEFTALMERERERQSEALRRAVDEEVWALHDKGWSVRKICGEYGTKDWNTVNQIIKRRIVVNPIASTDDFTATREGDVYTVVSNGQSLTFTWEFNVPWLPNDAKGTLADRIRTDEEFVAKIVNSVA